MHAVLFASGVELGEYHRCVTVQRSISKVILVAVAIGCVNDEFFCRWIVSGGCANRCHIRAMTGFGHGEGTGDLEVHGTWQKGFVVVLGSQIQNC